MNTETKKPTIFVATPMYGGMCTGAYSAALMQLPMVMGQTGSQMYYSFMMNESLITRARNSLAYDFLDSDATHLMFIDADIGFNPRDIADMIKADKEIICGLYPKKEIHWPQVHSAVQRGVTADQLHNFTGTFVVNLINAESAEVQIGEPFEIENGGTGFMLIKREVFEKLKDQVPTYTNDMFHAVDTERKPKIVSEFFATSICPNTNRLLSEDYHFCQLARANGISIYAAPWARLSHTGSYIFDGKLLTVKEAGK